jgi:hypothetical protein
LLRQSRLLRCACQGTARNDNVLVKKIPSPFLTKPEFIRRKTQIIADKTEIMAQNLRKSAKSADKIINDVLPKFW